MKVVGVVPAAAAWLGPFGCGDNSPGYLSGTERRALSVWADLIFPPDDHGPGAADLGAVNYIEQLLTAFDHSPPRIHAAGPFSGRQPFVADDGSPSRTSPPDGFHQFLPLDRVQEAGWRLRLYGSQGVGGGPNDAIVGPYVGLRDFVRDTIAAALAGIPSDQLDDNAIRAAFDSVSDEDQRRIEELVFESLFALPEYGGNRGLGGWRAIYFEGDSMPLGYTYIDPVTGDYHDRPGEEVMGPSTLDDPEPMDDQVTGVLAAAVAVLGGKRFP